jgi:hypothetical protein
MGHHESSVVIKGSSVVISRHQEASGGNQWSSWVISPHLRRVVCKECVVATGKPFDVLVPDEGGNQKSSAAHPPQSTANSRHQTQSDVVSRPSAAIRRNQAQSGAIRRNQAALSTHV